MSLLDDVQKQAKKEFKKQSNHKKHKGNDELEKKAKKELKKILKI